MAEHNRLGLILVFMFILLLTPDTGPVTRRNETEQALERAKRELAELQNSTYGVPGNITGFEDVGKVGIDGKVVLMPPKGVRRTVKEMTEKVLGAHADLDESLESVSSEHYMDNNDTNIKVNSGPLLIVEGVDRLKSKREQLHLPLGHTELPIYYNATGGIYGNWHRLYDLPPYKPNNSTKDIGKNITGTDGKITIRINEARPGEVQEVEAHISFESENGFDSHDVLMSGVHLVKSGDMVLTTNSQEYVISCFCI